MLDSITVIDVARDLKGFVQPRVEVVALLFV